MINEGNTKTLNKINERKKLLMKTESELHKHIVSAKFAIMELQNVSICRCTFSDVFNCSKQIKVCFTSLGE